MPVFLFRLIGDLVYKKMKEVTTTINLPGSKSIAARALVCRLLSGHDTRIGNLPDCGDTRGMLRLTDAVRKAGKTGGNVRVDIGEGGTTLRFGMAACASIPDLDITLIGSPKLMMRPHTTLIEALASIGADINLIKEENGIHIKGKALKGGNICLDGSISSQYLSAMMLAAPLWEENTTFRIKRPIVSFPYISMTAGVMRAFGAHVEIKENEQYIEVNVKADGYAQCAGYDVEGDWSAASYFFEAKLIQMHNSQFTIHNLLHASATNQPIPNPQSTLNEFYKTLKAPAESLQGDSKVAAIFAEATRRLEENDSSQMVMNLNDAPDLVPAIVVGFCLSGIHFKIEGVAHLRHKESDRMAAISTEILKLGYVLTCGDDIMEWKGERCEPEKKPLICTYQDHRMAMAFAPAKMIYPALEIENPEVVAKSFPDFWNEMDKMKNENLLRVSATNQLFNIQN